ncbi:MAG: lysozyme [Parerythrobacter sp.]
MTDTVSLPPLRTATAPASPGIIRGQTKRRRDAVRRLVNRFQERRRTRRFDKESRIAADVRPRRRKRKVALALSASVVGLNALALDTLMPQAAQAAIAPADMRQNTESLQASDALKQALIEEEGVRFTVYRDVAGYATVGVGHLVQPDDGLRIGDRIDEDTALELLDEDLAHAENVVRDLVDDMPVNQYEFDALVDLVYNVGEGTVSERNSPALNAALDAHDYHGVAEELAYHNAGGAKAGGLVIRSERRTNIFLNGDYADPRDTSVT